MGCVVFELKVVVAVVLFAVDVLCLCLGSG